MQRLFYKKIQEQRGQITVEYILLAVVLVSLFTLMTKTLKDGDYLNEFHDGPTKLLKSMVQNGNFELDEDKSFELHPNQHDMHYTPDANL